MAPTRPGRYNSPEHHKPILKCRAISPQFTGSRGREISRPAAGVPTIRQRLRNISRPVVGWLRKVKQRLDSSTFQNVTELSIQRAEDIPAAYPAILSEHLKRTEKNVDVDVRRENESLRAQLQMANYRQKLYLDKFLDMRERLNRTEEEAKNREQNLRKLHDAEIRQLRAQNCTNTNIVSSSIVNEAPYIKAAVDNSLESASTFNIAKLELPASQKPPEFVTSRKLSEHKRPLDSIRRPELRFRSKRVKLAHHTDSDGCDLYVWSSTPYSEPEINDHGQNEATESSNVQGIDLQDCQSPPGPVLDVAEGDKNTANDIQQPEDQDLQASSGAMNIGSVPGEVQLPVRPDPTVLEEHDLMATVEAYNTPIPESEKPATPSQELYVSNNEVEVNSMIADVEVDTEEMALNMVDSLVPAEQCIAIVAEEQPLQMDSIVDDARMDVADEASKCSGIAWNDSDIDLNQDMSIETNVGDECMGNVIGEDCGTHSYGASSVVRIVTESLLPGDEDMLDSHGAIQESSDTIMTIGDNLPSTDAFMEYDFLVLTSGRNIDPSDHWMQDTESTVPLSTSQSNLSLETDSIMTNVLTPDVLYRDGGSPIFTIDCTGDISREGPYFPRMLKPGHDVSNYESSAVPNVQPDMVDGSDSGVEDRLANLTDTMATLASSLMDTPREPQTAHFPTLADYVGDLKPVPARANGSPSLEKADDGFRNIFPDELLTMKLTSWGLDNSGKEEREFRKVDEANRAYIAQKEMEAKARRAPKKEAIPGDQDEYHEELDDITARFKSSIEVQDDPVPVESDVVPAENDGFVSFEENDTDPGDLGDDEDTDNDEHTAGTSENLVVPRRRPHLLLEEDPD